MNACGFSIELQTVCDAYYDELIFLEMYIFEARLALIVCGFTYNLFDFLFFFSIGQVCLARRRRATKGGATERRGAARAVCAQDQPDGAPRRHFGRAGQPPRATGTLTRRPKYCNHYLVL
jgi:hypothetical protein